MTEPTKTFLSRMIVGKRESPLPEDWVLSVWGNDKEGLNIEHIAHFGAGEQAEERAIIICRVCNLHNELVAALKRMVDSYIGNTHIPTALKAAKTILDKIEKG